MTQDRIPLDAGSSRPVVEGETATQTEFNQVGMTLNFFASVIKSGEGWTATCQHEYDAAHACLSQLRAAIPSAPVVEGVEPVAYVDREGKLSVTGDNLVNMLAELPDAPVGQPLVPLYTASAISRLVKERDEALRKLFPYADATEISGMSWNGFYLIGDKKSIKELQRIENQAAQIEVYRTAFKERVAAEKARAVAAEASVARLTALLAEADEVVKPFAAVPPNGTFGGPLVGAKGVYEDGSDEKYAPLHSFLGHEPFAAARRYLQKREAK